MRLYHRVKILHPSIKLLISRKQTDRHDAHERPVSVCIFPGPSTVVPLLALPVCIHGILAGNTLVIRLPGWRILPLLIPLDEFLHNVIRVYFACCQNTVQRRQSHASIVCPAALRHMENTAGLHSGDEPPPPHFLTAHKLHGVPERISDNDAHDSICPSVFHNLSFHDCT